MSWLQSRLEASLGYVDEMTLAQEKKKKKEKIKVGRIVKLGIYRIKRPSLQISYLQIH